MRSARAFELVVACASSCVEGGAGKVVISVSPGSRASDAFEAMEVARDVRRAVRAWLRRECSSVRV